MIHAGAGVPKTVIICQTALAKRGVVVLIVPAHISASVADFFSYRLPRRQRRNSRADSAGALSGAAVATLPEQIGEPAPVNSRQISTDYGGKIAVLNLGMGDLALQGTPAIPRTAYSISPGSERKSITR
jgi:hypothetical protein